MLNDLDDFLESRNREGQKWPSKKLIYFWVHSDFHGFNREVVRRLGRKLLIDNEKFSTWLNRVTEQQGN